MLQKQIPTILSFVKSSDGKSRWLDSSLFPFSYQQTLKNWPRISFTSHVPPWQETSFPQGKALRTVAIKTVCSNSTQLQWIIAFQLLSFQKHCDLNCHLDQRFTECSQYKVKPGYICLVLGSQSCTRFGLACKLACGCCVPLMLHRRCKTWLLLPVSVQCILTVYDPCRLLVAGGMNRGHIGCPALFLLLNNPLPGWGWMEMQGSFHRARKASLGGRFSENLWFILNT